MSLRSKLEGRYAVVLDLSKLSVADLEWLGLGVNSEMEARRREDESGRCWNIPPAAVEVFIVK